MVQSFVIGEAYLEGSHIKQAFTKDSSTNSPFSTADNIRFPPIRPEQELDLTLLGKNPFPVPDARDGPTAKQTGSRTAIFADLAEDDIPLLDEIPEPETSITELHQQKKSFASSASDASDALEDQNTN